MSKILRILIAFAKTLVVSRLGVGKRQNGELGAGLCLKLAIVTGM